MHYFHFVALCSREYCVMFFLIFYFDSYIETRAIIQRPEVRFLSSTLDVEDCFVGIHVVKKIIMQNLTLFSAQYKWVEVKITNLFPYILSSLRSSNNQVYKNRKVSYKAFKELFLMCTANYHTEKWYDFTTLFILFGILILFLYIYYFFTLVCKLFDQLKRSKK